MRTLNQLLRDTETQEIHSNAFTKIVKCSECGTTQIMAGHIHDYICQDCIDRQDFNVKKLPGSTGQEHQYWTRKYTGDRTIQAIPRARSMKSEKQEG